MTDNKDYRLSVPCIPELDNIPLEEMSQILAERGCRFNVECINWKEQFPYHPLTSYSIAHSGNKIYIDFFVRCNYLRAVTSENNGPVLRVAGWHPRRPAHGPPQRHSVER